MWIPASSLSIRATNITEVNRNNTITVTTWVTLVLFVIVFLSREAIKFTVVRKFAIDDILTLLATMFAIGLSITTLILASDGLGVFGPLTVRRANHIMKGYYASNFLYIAALGFAKLALVTFFYHIHKVQQTHRRFVLGFGVFILVWTLASLVAVAFQCGLPRPWEVLTLHCYHSGAFWVVYCIIDMTTDVTIVMLSINLVVYLKVNFWRKAAVVACFAPRILVIGSSLTRSAYLYPITPHTDPSFNLWIPVVCTQVHVSLSIITACIPYMRPFFYNTESDVLKQEGAKRNMTESYGRYSSADYLREAQRDREHSEDSLASNSWRYSRTPDVSPRIPSPAPLSPLTPPRFTTPPISSPTHSRSPSDRGLRLHIPAPDQQTRRRSPKTASSHALSPECLSPLLSGGAFSPIPLTPRAPTPPPRTHTPPNITHNQYDNNLDPPPVRSPPQRFSLFPSPRKPRYSLIPQSYQHTSLSIPSTIAERSRLSTRPPAHTNHTPRTTAQPETRTPSPHPASLHSSPPAPPSSSLSSFSTRTRTRTLTSQTLPMNLDKVVYDDPLRILERSATTVAKKASVPILPRPPTSHPESHTSLTAYAISTPPPLPYIPQPYANTPPLTHPPAMPLPQLPQNPHGIHHTALFSSTSPQIIPQRHRNQRILTPRNTSRDFDNEPISPVSPPTKMAQGRGWPEDVGVGRRGWEEQRLKSAFRGAVDGRRGTGAGFEMVRL